MHAFDYRRPGTLAEAEQALSAIVGGETAGRRADAYSGPEVPAQSTVVYRRPQCRRRARRDRPKGQFARHWSNGHTCRDCRIGGGDLGDPRFRACRRRHRRSAGPQSRHDRWILGEQRPGRRLSRGRAGARRNAQDQQAEHRQRRFLSGPVCNRARGRRNPDGNRHPDSQAVRLREISQSGLPFRPCRASPLPRRPRGYGSP